MLRDVYKEIKLIKISEEKREVTHKKKNNNRLIPIAHLVAYKTCISKKIKKNKVCTKTIYMCGGDDLEPSTVFFKREFDDC